jgi:hypothetical protein
MLKSTNELLRPTEILENYPQVAEVWNRRELGYLLMLGIVRGRKFRHTCEILVTDVLELLELKKQKAA